MNKFREIAVEIVSIVGRDNIISGTHCATRLRLQVKDREIIDDDKIRQIRDVKGVFYNAGQYQIILGSGLVNKVYQEFVAEYQVSEVSKDEMTRQASGRLQRGIRNLSDVFVSIIPGLGATGLFLGLKGVIFNDTVLAWFGSTPEDVPLYVRTLSTVLCDTAFAFLAAFICWSTFKKFGGTPILGFLVGLMLVSPALPNAYDVASGNVVPIYMFGFIPLVGYQGSVLTALITGIIGTRLEIFFRKIMPESMDLIFTPFVVILCSVGIALLVLGPLVHGFEYYAIIAFKHFLSLPAGIGGFLIGFIYPIAVMTGMHHMFIMIETSLIASTGFNPLITVCAMYGFANAAVCLAISIKSHDAAFKTSGISATATQLLGISEPALFGVVMRTGERALGIMILSSALGGMLLSLLSIKANSYGLAVLLSPLMYIYDRYQLIGYVCVGIIVFIFAFALTTLLINPNKVAQRARKQPLKNAVA